jgi:mandelate racemase
VAEDWARRGFRGVKAKIGYPTVAEDLRVIRAMRAAVGPDIALMVDYNQSLTPAEAIERIRVLDGEGLTWVEEPVLANDFPGHAQVAREVRTPIQAGENWWGPEELRHAIAARSSDYVMLDVMKIGGVTGWQRASAMAAAAGLRVSNHLWPEISAQLLSVTPTAHWLEYADWWNPIVKEPLIVENGLAIPGPPIEWANTD